MFTSFEPVMQSNALKLNEKHGILEVHDNPLPKIVLAIFLFIFLSLLFI